jgi:hypothetical protein
MEDCGDGVASVVASHRVVIKNIFQKYPSADVSNIIFIDKKKMRVLSSRIGRSTTDRL